MQKVNRKRKLETTIYSGFYDIADREGGRKVTQRRGGGMFGVVRAWGLHVMEGVEHVHVEWECPDERSPGVILLAWLSEGTCRPCKQPRGIRRRAGSERGSYGDASVELTSCLDSSWS